MVEPRHGPGRGPIRGPTGSPGARTRRTGNVSPMDHRALQEWLDQRVADDQFSGSVLVWREGQPQFSYSGGYAHRGHGMRIMNRTRFAVASITKLVTAVTALRLVEDGRIGLSTPLVEVLPPEHQPAALTGAHTLHHLLSHTSGLANYHDDEAPGWGSFTSCWDRIPMYHVRRTADMLPLFADLPAVAEPGAEYRYCDANSSSRGSWSRRSPAGRSRMSPPTSSSGRPA